MTRQQRRSFAKYVAGIAKDMGLADWTLNFPPDPCDEPALAEVDTTYGRRIATIRVCADFAHQSPETQRNAVIHELIHVHFAHERQAVFDVLGLLGHEARDLATSSYRLGHEYGVDALADAIAPHYPLWMP